MTVTDRTLDDILKPVDIIDAAGGVISPTNARTLIREAYEAGQRNAEASDGRHGDITWENGWVERDGLRVRLSHKQYEVFQVLASRFGSIIPTIEIRRRIWRGEPVQLNTVEVHVSSLRRTLAPLGIKIPTDRGFGGYRLRVKPLHGPAEQVAS